MAKHVNDQISSYIDGTMPDREKAAFEKHIRECKKCKQILEETKNIVTAVRGIEEKPLPNGYFERLNAKLDMADGKEPRRVFNFNIYMKSLATVAALIFVVVMTRYAMKETNNFNSVLTKAVVTTVPNKEAAETTANEQKPEAKAKRAMKLAPPSALAEKKETEVNFDLLKSKDESVANYGVKKSKRILRAAGTVNAEAASVMVDKNVSGGQGYNVESMSNAQAAPSQLSQANISINGMISKQWQGRNSGQKTPANLVFKDSDSWQQFLESNSGIKADHPDISVTDFNSDMLVIIFTGEKPTAGYSVEITGVQKTADKVIVQYRENVPAEGAIEAQVLTHPYCIKAIENTTLPVEFQKVQ